MLLPCSTSTSILHLAPLHPAATSRPWNSPNAGHCTATSISTSWLTTISDTSRSMKATTAPCRHTWRRVSSTPFTGRCWMNSDAEKGGSRERFLPFYFARRWFDRARDQLRRAECGHRRPHSLWLCAIEAIQPLQHVRRNDRITYSQLGRLSTPYAVAAAGEAELD